MFYPLFMKELMFEFFHLKFEIPKLLLMILSKNLFNNLNKTKREKSFLGCFLESELVFYSNRIIIIIKFNFHMYMV